MKTSSARRMDISLRMGADRRIGQFACLRLRLPRHLDDDFYTCVHFRTSPDGICIHADHAVAFSGDDTHDGAFHPLPSQNYTLLLYKDGGIKGFLRRETCTDICKERR